MKKPQSLRKSIDKKLKKNSEVPQLLLTVRNKSELKLALDPVLNRRAKLLKRERGSASLSKNNSVDRDLIEKFLSGKKRKNELSAGSRDISHLKDKGSFSCRTLKNSDKIVFVNTESQGFPVTSSELAYIGQNSIGIFPVALGRAVAGKIRVNDKRVFKVSMCEEFINARVPGRQDVKKLVEWYEAMKHKYFYPEIEEVSLAEAKGVVFCAFRELYAQISFNCHERGVMLMELLQNYAKIIDKHLECIERQHATKINFHQIKLDEIQAALNTKISHLEQTLTSYKALETRFKESESRLLLKIHSLESQILKNPP